VIPLVIPPVMNNTGTADNYDIAVRQFKQQILPGGIWDILAGTSYGLPATTIWSYGPRVDLLPDQSLLGGPFAGLAPGVAPAANSQFNYPAYTIETMSNVPVSVRWRNELKPNFGAGPGWLEHLLPVDQTLHWANPAQIQCMDGGNHTDCRPVGADDEEKDALQVPYTGPVPIVTHVHGAHVDPHSDGYPEAWWLPALGAALPDGYASEGTLFDDASGQARGLNTGYADYLYRQDQPATTLWYHDHSLGMTRSNVYAGPAGFWMVRGGLYDRPRVAGTRMAAKLPSPGPRAGQTVLELNLPTNIRAKIREIPIAIQARSFDTDGSLFYPDNRDFFEGLAAGTLAGFGVDFSPYSDVAPIWNPEAFFNVMVVNGVAWPKLEVAPALYRLRFLNGNNSRFLILQLVYVEEGADVNDSGNWNQVNGAFWQIGAEQGFLPAPVQLDQLLMGLAERADVIMDFAAIAASIPENSSLYLVNVGPDEPFNGIVETPADPATTGQVMKFVVNNALLQPQDARTTPPDRLDLMAEPALGALTNTTPRLVSLNEEESATQEVCFDDTTEEIVGPVGGVCPPGSTIGAFGPTAALLGTVTGSGAGASGNSLKWTDASDPNNVEKQVTLLNGAMLSVNVTENPALNSIEQWEIYNFTVDAHPIHLHLVRFEVVNREIFNENSPNYTADPSNIGDTRPPEGWETGFKDTVIAYPGEITRVKAFFDIEGLYVWHCHIVEHEDNEMMRPYAVGLPNAPAAAPAGAPILPGFGGLL